MILEPVPRRRRLLASKRFVWLTVTFLLVMIAVIACGAPAGPSIQAENAWARPALAVATSGGAGHGTVSTGAVFMLLKNEGREADRLVGGRTDVAQVVEIHETVMENDVMKMQMLADGLEIPAGGEVLLKSGSYHVMLIGMVRDLAAGDTFTLELEFEKSGPLTVEVTVREM
jgi:copper(I)-binding protein